MQVEDDHLNVDMSKQDYWRWLYAGGEAYYGKEVDVLRMFESSFRAK